MTNIELYGHQVIPRARELLSDPWKARAVAAELTALRRMQTKRRLLLPR